MQGEAFGKLLGSTKVQGSPLATFQDLGSSICRIRVLRIYAHDHDILHGPVPGEKPFEVVASYLVSHNVSPCQYQTHKHPGLVVLYSPDDVHSMLFSRAKPVNLSTLGCCYSLPCGQGSLRICCMGV